MGQQSAHIFEQGEISGKAFPGDAGYVALESTPISWISPFVHNAHPLQHHVQHLRVDSFTMGVIERDTDPSWLRLNQYEKDASFGTVGQRLTGLGGGGDL
jgi:hypothetical protein